MTEFEHSGITESIHSIASHNNKLFVFSTYRITEFELVNPESPQLIAFYRFFAIDCTIYKSFLLLGDSSVIWILDYGVSDPSRPLEGFNIVANRITTLDSFIIIGGDGLGIYELKVSFPLNPTEYLLYSNYWQQDEENLPPTLNETDFEKVNANDDTLIDWTDIHLNLKRTKDNR